MSLLFPEEWKTNIASTANLVGPFKYNKKGEKNEVYIGERCHIGNIRFDMLGNNNSIIIEENVYIKKAHFRLRGNNQTIKIGKNSRVNGVYFLCESGCSIEIGERCLFSYGISLRTTDAHHILNLETKEIVNYPKSIKIGDHVWLGTEALITKGVTICDDVIVGQRALVNKNIAESHVAVAGVPASIVKRGVTWKR
ncbi:MULTISPECIES: acyltransferase [unclassified Halomonas]|uniref:acyltransferase n=1 Tax=unclassified Halomonas TaxID=2609666 RepID=UPI004034E16E